MAAPVTFNGSTKIIQVDPGITTIDVQEVYSEWKRWVRLAADNAKWLPAFDVVGGDDLGGGLVAPIYFFLINGWTIRPDDTQGNHELTVALNLYARPATNDRFTPVSGVTISNKTSDSAIQNIELLEFSSFQNQVTVDTVYGSAGTAFPQGTVEAPVDNLTDALTIAAERGLNRLHFKSDYTFVNGDNVAGYELSGEAPSRTTLTFNSGSVTTGAELFNATVEGSLGAIAAAKGCHLKTITGTSNLTGREINITNCLFEETITLSSGFGGEIQVLDCYSGVAGQATPTFDLNGADVDVVVRNYSGGAELRNFSNNAGQVGSLDFHSGQLILDSTCTNGTLTVRGRCKVTDNSGVGCTVNDESSNEQISNISGGGAQKIEFNVGPLNIPIG